MIELNLTQAVPLAQGNDGTIRVAGSRVTLDAIVHQFKNGATAEQIQEDYPSLALASIYTVIAWYLQHRPPVEQYLIEQAQAAAEVRREVEKNLEARELRERLRQRRAQEAV